MAALGNIQRAIYYSVDDRSLSVSPLWYDPLSFSNSSAGSQPPHAKSSRANSASNILELNIVRRFWFVLFVSPTTLALATRSLLMAVDEAIVDDAIFEDIESPVSCVNKSTDTAAGRLFRRVVSIHRILSCVRRASG